MSKPIDQELLPCPFCGGHKTEVCHDDGLAWTRCKSCGATGPALTKYSGEEGEPCTDWNTRASVQPSGVAVPDGWRLVPIEPTELMLGRCHLLSRIARAAWIDMLAAAPHPVSGEQKAEEPTIVGVRVSSDGFGSYIADSSMGLGALYPGDVREPLMTVSQHNRIIEAIAARRAQQGEQT